MTAYTDDDVTADHGPLCANGVRCPDCGWPVPPEHDAAIAARALREAVDEIAVEIVKNRVLRKQAKGTSEINALNSIQVGLEIALEVVQGRAGFDGAVDTWRPVSDPRLPVSEVSGDECPPEPAVGSVVRAHGRLWACHAVGLWYRVGGAMPGTWEADLATAPDLSPVVAVEDVADWLREGGYFGLADILSYEFGGGDK